LIAVLCKLAQYQINTPGTGLVTKQFYYADTDETTSDKT